MSVTLHAEVSDIQIEGFCERTPKPVQEEEATLLGARNLRMNIVTFASTMLEVLYIWLIIAQTPKDLSSSPMPSSHIWT
uniref:Uncharacterized protein n=1 Tax=Suricata suricatta TaxID=37032 RepID=A0A673SNY4_SURSU